MATYLWIVCISLCTGDGIHNWMVRTGIFLCSFLFLSCLPLSHIFPNCQYIYLLFQFVEGYSAVLEGRLFDYNSPLERAYRGTGTVKASGGDVHSEKHIEFHNQMLALQDEYYRKSSSWLPNYDGDVDNNDMEKTSRTELLHPFHYENYDWSHLEDNGYDAGSFMYEATILLGLAACDEFNYQINKIQQQRQQILKEKQQEKEQQEYNNSTDASEAATEKELYQEDIVKLLGDDFYRRIVQTTFEGTMFSIVFTMKTTYDSIIKIKFKSNQNSLEYTLTFVS